MRKSRRLRSRRRSSRRRRRSSKTSKKRPRSLELQAYLALPKDVFPKKKKSRFSEEQQKKIADFYNYLPRVRKFRGRSVRKASSRWKQKSFSKHKKTLKDDLLETIRRLGEKLESKAENLEIKMNEIYELVANLEALVSNLKQSRNPESVKAVEDLISTTQYTLEEFMDDIVFLDFPGEYEEQGLEQLKKTMKYGYEQAKDFTKMDILLKKMRKKLIKMRSNVKKLS